MARRSLEQQALIATCRAQVGACLDLKALGGPAPAPWRRKVMDDLQVRFVQTPPRTLASVNIDLIRLSIGPTTTPFELRETLLHECVHIADFHAALHGAPREIDRHGPCFWARMTLAARELQWIHPACVLHRDGQLTRHLQSLAAAAASP